MKRLLSLALLGAVALAVPVANAQMRGGGGMMGGRGPVMSHGPVGAGPAFGRGPAFASGPVVARGPAFAPRGPAFVPRGPVGAPRVSPAVVAGRPAGTRIVASPGHFFFTSNPFGFNPFFFNHFHHHHFFISACAGFSCFNNPFFFGSNFGFGGFGSPFWSYPYYGYGGYYPYSDYTSAAPQQTVSTDTGSQVELAREVQRLSDQIEDLRYEEGRRAAPPPPSSSGTSLSARTPAIATTFVMRDGSHVVAQNYALTGQTLWIFDEHKARKIPLSDIDREATEKFNAANGIEIRLP